MVRTTGVGRLVIGLSERFISGAFAVELSGSHATQGSRLPVRISLAVSYRVLAGSSTAELTFSSLPYSSHSTVKCKDTLSSGYRRKNNLSALMIC